MAFNFDEEVVRLGSGSIKWDQYHDPNIIAMSNADMDFKSASCIRDALIRCAQTGQYGYTLKPDSYYEAIIGWYRRKYHLNVPRESILHTPGIWPATRICFGTYAKPGDYILVQAPHFHPIIVCIEDAGCQAVTNPMPLIDGTYELDLEDFEQKIIQYRPSVFFLVNPQNPTGRAFTREELTALGKICVKHGVIIIADEVHSNILYHGHQHTPAISLDEDIVNQLILITSASKGYNIMGLTHCILIIPNQQLRAKYEKSMCGYSLDFAVNTFSIAATEAAFSPEADEWLSEVTNYLEGNLEFLTEYIEKYIPEIKVIQPESSYLVWLDCRGLGMTPEELKEFFLHEAKVGLTFGEGYGALGNGFERINIACTRRTLQTALERIQRAIENRLSRS